MGRMKAEARVVAAPRVAPLWGELRYSAELVRLLGDGRVRSPRRRPGAQPVMLIPGFMAGDASLLVLREWLRKRGHRIAQSGIRANVDCAERTVSRLQEILVALADEAEAQVAVIGQSRGGALARALAVREPDHVCALVMLGSPTADPLAVAPQVLRTVRFMARLGDLRIPGVFSTTCRDGDCCAEFQADMTAPLDPRIRTVAIHSRSDGIVDWRACLDDHCDQVEVESSHCGMSVHPAVYRTIDEVLDETEAR
jgi:pimeloyl-ACP methyl ester carboxylesterase